MNPYVIPGLPREEIIIDIINKKIEKVFGYNHIDLTKTSQHRKIADARHMGISFLLRYTSLTEREIARHYNRDRSTVPHAFRKVKYLLQHDLEFRAKYKKIDELISQKMSICS